MAKEIVLGNKKLSISYDSNINIKDIYYPYIGDENQLEEDKNRIGFWVAGKFSWIDEEWKKDLNYQKDSLVSNIKASTDYLNIEIKEKAAVHFDKNIYLRIIKVKNNDSEEKEVRIFFHHILKLYGKNKNNTAIYDPITKSIIHYKKNRYFLFNGKSENDSIYQYRAGTIDIGTEGDYKDAEDGKLEVNEAAQGKVNSIISLRDIIPAEESKIFYYWFCAGDSFEKVRKLNEFVINEGVERLIYETKTYWESWISKRNIEQDKIETKLINQYKKSLILIKSHINSNGSIITSSDFEHCEFNRDTYNYVIPRDGVITAMALDNAGYTEISRNFFRFIKKIIGKGGYLWQKYYPDGAIAAMWHSWYVNNNYQLPIQEDQTAMILIALAKHYEISKDMQFIEELYKDFIKRTVNFLCEYMDDNKGIPCKCYDVWGDREGFHFVTAASVYEALIVSKKFVKMFGSGKLYKKIEKTIDIIEKNIVDYFWDNEENRFLRTIKFDLNGEIQKDYKYDSSILYITFFDKFYEKFNEKIDMTLDKTIEKLTVKTDIGGIARYEHDTFHQFTKDIKKVTGNPWLTSTLLTANYYIEKGDYKKALNYIKKVENWKLKSGVFSEQVHPYTGEPVSAGPYIPAHSLYVYVIDKLKLSELI